MNDTIFTKAVSAFRILELRVNATENDIVERETELSGKNPARGAEYRVSREQLVTRRRDRLRHELMEIPGACYAANDWGKFWKKFERNPIGLARFNQNSTLPNVADFDWKAFLHQVIEERISASASDLSPAIKQSPFPPGHGPTPIQVYDVIFG